jgi:hypothetical protein
MLLAVKRKKLHAHIKNGRKMSWKEERDLDQYCNQMSVQVQDLEESTHLALEKNDKCKEVMQQLVTCDYKGEEFKKKIEEIQSITDDLIFNDFSNIAIWVNIANEKIESILTNRVEVMIKEWLDEFQNYQKVPKKHILYTPVHEIKIEDQQL